MKLEILQVPDCPNVSVLEVRIQQAIAGEPIDVEVVHRGSIPRPARPRRV